jgi:hypothetical protein
VVADNGYDPTGSPTPVLWSSTESTRIDRTSASSSARTSVIIFFLVDGQP